MTEKHKFVVAAVGDRGCSSLTARNVAGKPPSSPKADSTRHTHLRRLERVWSQEPIYFLTTCTDNRAKILADEMVASILVDEWEASRTRHGWSIGRYVIMPDHVHFFCCPSQAAKQLCDFMRAWKQWTSKRIRAVAAFVEGGYSTSQWHLWQREFFDHVLRSTESYAEKWEYVRQNPVRAGLVADAANWKFQGEIEVLEL